MQKEWTKKQNEEDLNTKSANAFGGTFVFFFNALSKAKKSKRATKPTHKIHCKQWTTQQRQTEGQLVTGVWLNGG